MDIIITTPQQLEITFMKILKEFLSPKEEATILSDRCYMKDVVELTGLSKSKIYKLTAENLIPCELYLGRLVFSRSKIAEWIEQQTVPKIDQNQVLINIAKSARSKMCA